MKRWPLGVGSHLLHMEMKWKTFGDKFQTCLGTKQFQFRSNFLTIADKITQNKSHAVKRSKVNWDLHPTCDFEIDGLCGIVSVLVCLCTVEHGTQSYWPREWCLTRWKALSAGRTPVLMHCETHVPISQTDIPWSLSGTVTTITAQWGPSLHSVYRDLWYSVWYCLH